MYYVGKLRIVFPFKHYASYPCSIYWTLFHAWDMEIISLHNFKLARKTKIYNSRPWAMSHELESVTEPRYHGGGPSTLKAWKFVFLCPSLLLNGSEIHQYGKILMENSAGKDGIMWISLGATEEATRMAHTSVGRWMFTTQVTAHRSQARQGCLSHKVFLSNYPTYAMGSKFSRLVFHVARV